MNYYITGITGFVGSHMVDYLLEKEPDATIYAIKRWRSDTSNIDHLVDNSRVIFIEADLLDRSSIRRSLKIAKPDVVYHFAAQSFPGASFKYPVKTLQVNIIGTVNLMEEILDLRDTIGIDPKIISVSSSEVYGMPEEHELPILEKNPIRAANPYSISKVGQDLMSQYYVKGFDLKIIITRMFSHEGPRRGDMFALSSFAKQIAKNEIDIEKNGKKEKFVFHGNLDSVRTYNHIKDAISAYYLCAGDNCKPGEIYNIGGDSVCTVGQALDLLISQSKYPHLMIKKIDEDRVRPTDITLQVPSSEKFRTVTGWEPTLKIDKVCEDLLNYWRNTLK